MSFLIKSTLLLAIWGLCLQAWAKPDLKADTLLYLQELRTQNVKRLAEIDSSLSEKIEDARSNAVEYEVSTLKKAKREHLLRQEFLDRLIFQVDTKFRDGELRPFMERALVEMAKTDVAAQNESGLWKFLKYAADAMRRLPEQKENVLAFLEGYMNRSVSNPINPEEYLSSRNYTNGSRSESGSPLKREDVGDVADRRLQEMAPAASRKSTN